MNKIKNITIILLCLYLIILIYRSLGELLNSINNILLPFLISFFISYLLDPIVNFFDRRIKKRIISTLFVLLMFIIIIIAIYKYTFPIILNEIIKIGQEMPNLIEGLKQTILNRFGDFDVSQVLNLVSKINHIPKLITESIELLTFIPILTFYILLELDTIKKFIIQRLSNRKKDKMIITLKQIDKMMRNYLKGLFIVFIMLFIFSSIIFKIIGLRYFLFFALMISITNIIPYFGSIIGLILVGVYTFIILPNKLFTVIISLLIIQLIESNFITPLIQAKQVKIHPGIILSSVIILNKLLGFIGMVLSIPIVSIIKIVFTNFKEDFNLRTKI